MYAVRMPKNVKSWMKEHTINDLEQELFERDGKNREVLRDVLTMLYEFEIDIEFETFNQIKVEA